MKELKIIRLETVDSTNEYLKKLAKNSLNNNTVVIANSQTNGKGTKGRTFISLEGGVYMSILVRPDLQGFDATVLTSMTAVAVSKSIEKISGKSTGIKWVNDIYLNNKKVCGILCEMGYDIQNKPFIIVGIGVNLFKPKNDFPDDIKDIATFVFDKEQNEVKKQFETILLDNFYELYNGLNEKTFLDYYRNKNIVLGKEINVITPNNTSKAKAIGIDDNCRLLVEYPDNSTKFLSSGEVQIKFD